MCQHANRVIVSGCGPVGAVMSLALVRKGISVTLIEQLPDAAEDQRAATVHPPTVEMLGWAWPRCGDVLVSVVGWHGGTAVSFP